MNFALYFPKYITCKYRFYFSVLLDKSDRIQLTFNQVYSYIATISLDTVLIVWYSIFVNLVSCPQRPHTLIVY